MSNDFSKIQQSTFRYWYIDGLYEISFGGISLLLSGYFYIQSRLIEKSLLYQVLNLGLVILIVGGGFLANKLVIYIKERLTYPRTGYITYHPKPGKSRWVGMVVGAVMAALIAWMFTRRPGSLVWMPAATGVLIGGVWLMLGLRVDLLRFYILAAASIVIGLGLSLTESGDLFGLSAYYGLTGLVLIFAGGCTLYQYLRNTTPVEDISHEQ
jgi:hypothetical protein